jgi:hypothetical protein
MVFNGVFYIAMKNEALNTGFLRLMTSAIDARELFAVKCHYHSNSNSISNSTTAFFYMHSLTLKEYVLLLVGSLNLGTVLCNALIAILIKSEYEHIYSLGNY